MEFFGMHYIGINQYNSDINYHSKKRNKTDDDDNNDNDDNDN